MTKKEIIPIILNLKMEKIAAQHLYLILSYLWPSHTLRVSYASRLIQRRLRNNPYLFAENLGFDLNSSFEEILAKLKHIAEVCNPG